MMHDQCSVPLVSVVIPAFERPVRLKSALKSVTDQTYGNIEVIVVDDGSEPPLSNSLAKLEGNGVKYIQLENNMGANYARNKGIEVANGEYVAFLDDDDRWQPEKIELQINKMEDDSSTGVVYTGQQFQDESGDKVGIVNPSHSGNVTRDLLVGKEIAPFSCLLVDSDTIDKAGKPDPYLPIKQDREWLIRLSLHTEFQPVPLPLVNRQLGDYKRVSFDYEGMKGVTYPHIYQKYTPLAKKDGILTYLQFRAYLFRLLSSSAITSGYYNDAMKYSAFSLLFWPPSLKSAKKFVAAIIGLVNQYLHL